MSQPVVKFLSGGTATMSYPEIPQGALPTKFYNALGGKLHLVGTAEEIAKADKLMQKSPVVFDDIEYNFRAD